MPEAIHVLRKFEPAAWGGIETHIVALLPELCALGWATEVHAPREAGTDPRPLLEAGARFRAFDASYPYLGLDQRRRASLVACGGNLVSLDELGALLRASRADIFHTHAIGRLGGIVRTAARLTGRPYAVTLHGPVRSNHEAVDARARESTRGLIDVGAPFGLAVGARRVVEDADLVYVLNDAERDAWAPARRGRHLEVLRHGVSTTRASARTIAEARALAPGLGDAPYVAVVGRLEHAKGQDLAVEAFCRVAPPDTHLIVAGAAMDADFERHLRALSTPHARRVHLVGGVPPHLARGLLAGSRLTVIPSRAEPFGIVLLEAWAEHAPTLYADIDGMASIARSVGAREGAIDDLAKKMSRALEDPAPLACEARRAAPHVARLYAWATTAQRLDTGYRSMLTRKAAS